MTSEESTVVCYHLDQLEALLDAREDKDGLMHVGAIKNVLSGSHGAAAHAPNKRRKKSSEAGIDADPVRPG